MFAAELGDVCSSTSCYSTVDTTDAVLGSTVELSPCLFQPIKPYPQDQMDGNVRDLLDVVKKEKVSFRPYNLVLLICCHLCLYISYSYFLGLQINGKTYLHNLRGNWKGGIHITISLRVIERGMLKVSKGGLMMKKLNFSKQSTETETT